MANDGVLAELSLDECVELLGSQPVGRIAFISGEAPMVLPVNYRLVKRAGPHWLLIRTRGGSSLDNAASKFVAFEIDGIDPANLTGWSVVARGTLHHLDEDEVAPLREFDPGPWAEQRDEWLVVKCSDITGRRLSVAGDEWPFSAAGYI